MPCRLTPEQLQRNFAEIAPAMTSREARIEAARCLYCYDAPCTRACPTRIDVPLFIRQILQGDPLGAARTILNANIFGGSCARACPTEVLCEGVCVAQALDGAPVQIGRLQRYACDFARARGRRFHQPGKTTGKRVAVVGAGPAGLTCAHELRKHGHEVVVFEARDLPGGLNTHGIAAYKYDTAFALGEIEQIEAMGMEIRCHVPLTGDQIAALLDEYEAVFLGIGLGKTAPAGIPGESLPGVWEAIDFVSQTHTRPLHQCEVGRQVVVIGGGNTAIDAATTAARLGAEAVTIAYRRTREAMPAFAYEFELAVKDGVRFEWLAEPLRILERDGRCAGVEFSRTRMTGPGRSAPLQRVPGETFTITADMVILALGQQMLTELLQAIPDLKITDGRVVIEPGTGATSVPGLFAGGDCVHGGAHLVHAVRDGKIAAAGIHAMLQNGVHA